MPREKDVMSLMAASSQRQTARRKTPQEASLWPSGRGTEIGHFEHAVMPLVKKLNQSDLTHADFVTVTEKGAAEIILRDFAGERAVTLVKDPSQSRTVIAIIADQNGQHERILHNLRLLLGPSVNVIAAPPERPGPGAVATKD